MARSSRRGDAGGVPGERVEKKEEDPLLTSPGPPTPTAARERDTSARFFDTGRGARLRASLLYNGRKNVHVGFWKTSAGGSLSPGGGRAGGPGGGQEGGLPLSPER